MAQLALCLATRLDLKVFITAIMSERALELGGIHIAQLFCIPVNDATYERKAEMALAKLLRKPALMHLLKTIDILVLDEVGQVSSKMLMVMDQILRCLQGSSLFLGGVHMTHNN